jgi:hypothetical protein
VRVAPERDAVFANDPVEKRTEISVIFRPSGRLHYGDLD